MSSRTLIAILTFVLLLALLSLSSPPGFSSEGKPPIKIGVVLSTTGGAAEWGQNAKNGVELARDEINNERINGQEVEILFRDSKTDSKVGTTALRELIDRDKVQVVIGDITSTCMLEMAEIAEERKIVLITPGASYPKLTQEKKFVFRYWYSDELEGKEDARHAKENLGWSNVTTLYLDVPYGQGINEVFVREFRKLGGTVTRELPFKQGQTDFRSQARAVELQDSIPDGIFLVGYVNETAAVLKELRDRFKSKPIRILSSQPFNSLSVVRKAEGAAENVVFSVPRPPESTYMAAEHFRQIYNERHKKDIVDDPADFSATAYDSLRLIADALKSGASTSDEIREWLKSQKGFQGAAFGPVTFSNGEISPAFVFKRVRDGKFELLGSAEPIETPKPSGAVKAFLRDTAVQVIGGGIVILTAALLALFRFRYLFWIWQRWQWRMSRVWFWYRRGFNKSGRKIVTLHDYVDILEEFRNVIVKRCNHLRGDKKAEIAIYSYTMQLPRDWPLWQVDLQTALQHPTPLERYFTSFAEFKKLAESQKYSVKLIRVIIIDSNGSPAAESRLKDLEEDVNSKYFQDYINLIHTDEQDAYYYLHPRPWPGWLSDSVFYAIKEPERERKWLWGVTTSYNAGEDLIILRLHELGEHKNALAQTLSLPFEMASLDALAGMADGKMLSKTLLTSLRKG